MEKKKWGTSLDPALAERIAQHCKDVDIQISEFAEAAFRKALEPTLLDLFSATTPLAVSVAPDPRVSEAPCISLILEQWGTMRVALVDSTRVTPNGSDLIVIGGPKLNPTAEHLENLPEKDWIYRLTECTCDLRKLSLPEQGMVAVECGYHLATGTQTLHRFEVTSEVQLAGVGSDYEVDYGIVRYQVSPVLNRRILTLAGISFMGTFEATRAACSRRFLRDVRMWLGIAPAAELSSFECLVSVKQGVPSPVTPMRLSVRPLA